MKSFLISIALVICCMGCKSNKVSVNLDNVAIEFIKLGLTIGQYDPAFVDAYIGPDSLKPISIPGLAIPKDSLIAEIDSLRTRLEKIIISPQSNDTIRMRANWMLKQLTSFEGRINIFTGEFASFDEESLQLFGVQAPIYNEDHYQRLVSKLEEILPGKGSIRERFNSLKNKFIIPKNNVDTVLKAAISEARKRTKEEIQLPEGETVIIEYVTDKSWPAANQYGGNYTSRIQINLDLPISVVSLFDLVCHEGYPGHHVNKVLLEKNLIHDKDWLEVSFAPLYSPQSIISEGAANYGLRFVFPGDEFNQFIKEVLLPIAEIDTTNVDIYLKALSLKKGLNYTINEIARGALNGTMSSEEILKWQMNYLFETKEEADQIMQFIKEYRSYMICYNYGEDLVKNYVEAHNDPNNYKAGWQAFGWLLSNMVFPSDLLQEYYPL